MSTPIYPSTLPGVSRFVVRPDSILSDDGDGVKSFRRRSAVPLASGQVSWTFVEQDLQTFVTFGRTTLLGFHKWFWVKLPSAGGLTWHVVRIASGTKPEARMVGHGAWKVDADIILRKRAFDEQPEPPVDPEPPAGEPDVLVVIYSNGSTNFSGDSPVDILGTDMSRSQLTLSEYATLEDDGQITITQAGVYEITFGVTMSSNAFVSSQPYIGSKLLGNRTIRVTPDESVFNQPGRNDFTDARILAYGSEDVPATFNPAVYACGYFISDELEASFTLVVRRSGDLYLPL